MRYIKGQVRKSSTKLSVIARVASSLVMGVGMVVGGSSLVSARGRVATTDVGSIGPCSNTSITILVDTTANDKVNQYLIQADGVTTVIQPVGRRAVTAVSASSTGVARWSAFRQERDGWIPDLNTVIQADGTCGVDTW